jgi:DNA (cytosine-5)-methyltransferase 1
MARQLTFGSLFAGIGGFDLGFERAGMRCVWQVEIDPFCRKVLAKHWPNVRRWDDVRTFPPEPTEDWTCDVICGGFPCQDISASGRGAGIDGERSGLWAEFSRIVRVLRPRFVVVENSAILTARGLGRVLGDLAAVGFDAEWSVLSACAFGAPHTRERMFVVADSQPAERRSVGAEERRLADEHDRLQGEREEDSGRARECFATARRQWVREPGMARVVDGVPGRVDRLRGLGNAVVPQVAEWIGRRIVEALDMTL